MKRFPNFYCIGAQKSGTTWLHENLKRHPDVFMPFLKEVQYFNHLYIPEHRKWTDFHRLDRIRKSREYHLQMSKRTSEDVSKWLNYLSRLEVNALDDNWYSEFFSIAPPNCICGEVTPEYSLLPESGIRHMDNLSEETLYIFIIRNPIERDFSEAKMIMNNKGVIENIPIDENQGAEITIKEILKFTTTNKRSSYSKIIERWLNVIDSKRFLICYFDELKSSPEPFLKKICDFLKIPYKNEFFPVREKSVFKGPDFEMSQDIYEMLVAHHRQEIEYMISEHKAPWKIS